MSEHDETREREEYADWNRPGAGGAPEDDGPPAGRGGGPPRDGDDEDWDAPSTIREPLLRDRLRERVGVSPRQWYAIESVLLAAPYLLFVLLYVTYDIPEIPFLVVTLVYSLVAIYVGLLP